MFLGNSFGQVSHGGSWESKFPKLKNKFNYGNIDTKEETASRGNRVHQAKVQTQDKGVQIAAKAKRTITRPSYLSDHV